MNEILIVGIGNPFRGDDGAGWAVIDILEKTLKGQVKLCKTRGDIAELMDLFASHSCIYLIDAGASEASPGSWKRINALKEPLLEDNQQTSTHGLGISQAVALAKNLQQLPSKLILYAIIGDHYSISETLSSPVTQAIQEVVQHILNEEDIQACMKKA